MKKAIYAVGIVALSLSLFFSIFFVWWLTRRFEMRVVPRISGSVVDSRGELIEITESEIIALNDAIGSVDVDILGTGEFSVAPRTAMRRSAIGYSCTDTLVSVDPTGYKKASHEVSICNEEKLLEYPPIEFTITFRLRTTSEEGQSSTAVTRVDRYLGSETHY